MLSRAGLVMRPPRPAGIESSDAMCTVTVVPLENGFRLCCNRDERRERPTASPPIVQTFGCGRAMFPVDPISQGTWVAVNDAGLTMALLNRSTDSIDLRDSKPRVSRGRIIPALLACGSVDEALEHCSKLDAASFDGFRLLMVQNALAIIMTSDARALTHEVTNLSRPMMWTSSSLGDAVVEGPRRKLFDRLFDEDRGTWLPAQRRFHRHRWRRHPEISVMMERRDARTVSRTAIDVRSHVITLTYRPVGSPSADDRIFSKKIER
jgi:hypothetical protein